MDYDVFISHASEDKKAVADPICKALMDRGYRVWYDAMTLKLGDRLRESIEAGLTRCRYGVVILSPNFFRKRWPQSELDGFLHREGQDEKIILPVWHEITVDFLKREHPLLADRIAVETKEGIGAVVDEIVRSIGEPLGPATATQGEPEQRRSEGLTALVAAARSGTRQDIDKIMSAADAPAALPRHMIDFALDLVDSKEGRGRLHDYLQTGTRDQKHLAALHFKKRGELGDEA